MDNHIIFRQLSSEEIPTALALAWRVFSEFESPDYSAEGTQEFYKCLSDAVYLSGIRYYGAFDRDILIAVFGIRELTAHICFFFVDGNYHRKGIGTKLFLYAQRDFSHRSITLNSSPYAVRFYTSLGFTPTDTEQTVNGIRFTPMILKNENTNQTIVKLSQRRDLKEKAAAWFSSVWHISEQDYLESIENSFSATVPSWYLCLEDGKIIAGMGVIENDFHNRRDLTPNVCAVYTEPDYRGKGIAGKLLRYVCEDMKVSGIDTLYLVTDHTGFYERYGWQYLCDVLCDGENAASRMYIHTNSKSTVET